MFFVIYIKSYNFPEKTFTRISGDAMLKNTLIKQNIRIKFRVRVTIRKNNEKIKLEYIMKIIINFKLLIPALAFLIKIMKL